MTYRELLKNYRSGTLDASQTAQVAAEIEKHDAISEYLCENDEIPMQDTFNAEGMSVEEMQQESSDFSAMIRASIRKAFIKAGIIAVSLSVCIVLAIVFGLPKLVDRFYYDPTQGIGKNSFDADRLQLDLTVYSELFLPYRNCLEASAEGNGYGAYDITVYQNSSYTGTFPCASGTIKRNRMKMYDPNFFRSLPTNGFAPWEIGVDSMIKGTDGASGTSEEAYEKLGKLGEDAYYFAQFTLDQVYSYDAFTELCSDEKIFPEWSAMCYWDEESGQYTTGTDPIGFRCFTSSIGVQFDEKKYPFLTPFSLSDEASENQLAFAEHMKQHVLSMLRYTQDEPIFYEMMHSCKPDSLQQWETAVEKNGLNVYAFTVTAQKEELERIAALDEVIYVHTLPIN